MITLFSKKVPDNWFVGDTLRFDGDYYLEINKNSYYKWLFEIKAISPDRKKIILKIDFPFDLKQNLIEVKYCTRWVRKLNNLTLYDRKRESAQMDVMKKLNDWSEYNNQLIQARKDYEDSLEKIKKEYL